MKRLMVDERGAISVLAAGVMILMVGMAALTVDAGLWYLEHRRLRNAADAAALAAAGNPAQAQSIAALLMSQNGFAAENLVAVTPGYYCASTRSEEHTSELQSLMRNSYAVFCLKKKKKQ